MLIQMKQHLTEWTGGYFILANPTDRSSVEQTVTLYRGCKRKGMIKVLCYAKSGSEVQMVVGRRDFVRLRYRLSDGE